jgi:hypothetical protein
VPVTVEHEHEARAGANLVKSKGQPILCRDDEEPGHERGGAHGLIRLGRVVQPGEKVALGIREDLGQCVLHRVAGGQRIRRIESLKAGHAAAPDKGMQPARQSQRDRVAARVGPARPIQHASPDFS